MDAGSLHRPLAGLRKLRQPMGSRLSCSLQFLLIRHGSSCVLRSTSFIRSSLRSITPRSQLNLLLQGMACIATSQTDTHAVTYLSQANATILTGFHSASFIATSFQSCSVHPLPIIWLAGRPTSAAFTLRILIAYSYLISQSTAKVLLHSSAAFVPFGKFTPAASYGAGIGLTPPFMGGVRPLLPAPSWGLAAAFFRRTSSLWLLTAARLQRFSPSGFRGKAKLPFSRRRFYRPGQIQN